MNPHDSFLGAPAGRSQGFEMRPKLMIAYLGMGLVILVASVFGALILSNVDAGSARMIDDLSKRASMVARLRQEFLMMRVAEKNVIIEDTQEGMEAFEERLINREDMLIQVLKEIDAEGGAGDSSRLEEFRAALGDYRAAVRKMIGLSRAHTLARAAELSRGKGREAFQCAREALLRLIEVNRERIVQLAGEREKSDRVNELTHLVGSAREALEGMHDLQYFEQAILTVFSLEERAALAERLVVLEDRVRVQKALLEKAGGAVDLPLISEFSTALEAWAANNQEVCRLAQEDSKAKAMALSIGAVRDAYLRSSQTVDDMIKEVDRAMSEMRSAQEKALLTGRGLLIALATSGLLVVSMTGWVVVTLLMKEFRAAGDVLMRGA